MPRSLEHSNSFHMARRIAKVVAPDFRVLSTYALAKGDYVLDLEEKTIEVSELAREFEAASMILFAAGHIRLADDPTLDLHFGKASQFTGDAAELIARTAEQAARADASAAAWTVDILINNFNIEPISAHRHVSDLMWDASQWAYYFENVSN